MCLTAIQSSSLWETRPCIRTVRFAKNYSHFILAIIPAAGLTGTFLIKAVNLHDLGNNKTLNITIYLTAGVCSQIFFELVFPKEWIKKSNNWMNSWLLEIFEVVTQVSLNLNESWKTPFTQISVCVLGGSTATRIISSFFTKALSIRDQFDVLHPTSLEKAKPSIRLIEGPAYDIRWIAATKTIEIAGAGIMLYFGYGKQISWCKISGGVLAGYSCLGYCGRAWQKFQEWLKQGESQPLLLSSNELESEPRISRTTRFVKSAGKFMWDIRPIAIGALLVPTQIITLVSAGALAGTAKDLNQIHFEGSKPSHPDFLSNIKIDWLKNPFTAFKEMVLSDQIITAIKTTLFAGLYGLIIYNMTVSNGPSIAALATFGVALLVGWFLTRETYLSFHENGLNNTLINQIYFMLVKHPEIIPIIFTIIRQYTALNDKTLDNGSWAVIITACVGWGLFGLSLGNNRALQGMLGDVQASIPPSILAIFLMARTITKFYDS